MSSVYAHPIYHLTFFKGTKIYKRAEQEVLSKNDWRQKHNAYFDVDNNYINFLYSIYSVIHVPKRFSRILISNRLIKRNINISRIFFVVLYFFKDVRILIGRLINRDPTNVPVCFCFFRLYKFVYC